MIQMLEILHISGKDIRIIKNMYTYTYTNNT